MSSALARKLEKLDRQARELEASRRVTAVAAEEEARRAAARSSILDFTTYTSPTYQTTWYHRVICDFIDRVVRGEIKRGMIFAPPRHGKSEIVSRRLPGYYLGLHPDRHIIACSYSSGLASRMNRDVQRIMDGDAYKALFPKTRLYGKNIRTVAHGSWLRNNELFEVVDLAGSYRAAGVGGGVTGMGASLILLDDYLKSAAEARSDTIREGHWEWFTQDIYTRQAPNCAILIICTRWHHDDIPGRLLKAAEEGEGEPWEVLRIPALAEAERCHPEDPREEGEALWPERYSEEFLKRARKQQGARVFGSLYQQRPTPKEGGLFEEGWFTIQQAAPARVNLSHVVRVWDKGYSSEGDPSGGVQMALGHDGLFYITDVRELVGHSPRARNQAILNTAKTDKDAMGFQRTYLEQPPGAGTETTDTLVRLLAGYPVEVILPRGAKEERAEPLSDQVEAGNVVLIAGPWNRKFIDQCCQFPEGEHDDMVDAAAHAFNQLALHIPATTTPTGVDTTAEPAPLGPPAPRSLDRDRADPSEGWDTGEVDGDGGGGRKRYFGR